MQALNPAIPTNKTYIFKPTGEEVKIVSQHQHNKIDYVVVLRYSKHTKGFQLKETIKRSKIKVKPS